jgi:hypothetical protein
MTPLEEIRKMYFNTTKGTVKKDMARAIELLKSMKEESDREKAAVYMEGLAQMRSEWTRK